MRYESAISVSNGRDVTVADFSKSGYYASLLGHSVCSVSFCSDTFLDSMASSLSNVTRLGERLLELHQNSEL